MSGILFKTIGMLTFAIIWAILQIATTSREPIRHEGFNQLKPGLVSHISMVIIWAGIGLLFYVFHVSSDLQGTHTDEWVFAIVSGVFFLLTIQTYLTKILYDEYYLCFKSPFGIKIYDWDNLRKVSEWNYNSGDILVLKFSNHFFWVMISAMYEGYDELERLVYRKSFQYPRP